MKKLFNGVVLFLLILSIGAVAYAKSANYTYADGSVMKYQLYSINILGTGATGGITSTEADAICFVSIFSYKGNTVKNSATKQQSSYVTLEIKNKGGKAFKSYHSLKDENYKPLGKSLQLYLD